MVDFWIVLLPFPQLQLAKKNCLFGDQLIQNLGTKVSYFAESIELENVREYIDFFKKKQLWEKKWRTPRNGELDLKVQLNIWIQYIIMWKLGRQRLDRFFPSLNIQELY